MKPLIGVSTPEIWVVSENFATKWVRHINQLNITEAGRRKGHEAFKKNIAMTPTGGTRDPIKANAAFERALTGRCFCPPGKHYPNRKTGAVLCGYLAGTPD